MKVGQRFLKLIERKDDEEEAIIVEISPNGKWLKYENKHGVKYWIKKKHFKIVTQLEEREISETR